MRRLVWVAQQPPRIQLKALRWFVKDCYRRATTGDPLVISDCSIRFGNDRTAYIVGLFGTGRKYISELIVQYLGERAKYFRDELHLHSAPTSMIYSNHATMKYPSHHQHSPAFTSRMLESVRLGFADLIFVYRHPLDSLISNWIWWRIYLRDGFWNGSLSTVYKHKDDLYADLDRNFSSLKAFAEGDPDFFAAVRPPRFLSFPEFVEETALFVESATLSLRLEDFAADPLKEFSKIVKIVSPDVDPSRLQLHPPRTKPFGYLAVKDAVPQFRDFITNIDPVTKSLIERIGYNL